MNKYFFVLLLGIALLSTVSCKKEYEAPQSNVVEMSGRWWMNFVIDVDGDGVMTDVDVVPYPAGGLYATYADFGEPTLVTSNVASNAPDSILIDDHEFWPLRGKFPVDLGNKVVSSVSGIPNLLVEDGTVTVHEGKILPGAATALSGRAADSIFLALEFSDDAGIIYFYTGIRYSGQLDDNY